MTTFSLTIGNNDFLVSSWVIPGHFFPYQFNNSYLVLLQPGLVILNEEMDGVTLTQKCGPEG